MHPSEFAVSPEKAGIARHGLLEQPYRFTRAHGLGGLPYADCFQVKIVGDKVARGRTRDSGFFAHRDFGLELISDRLAISLWMAKTSATSRS